MNIQQKRDFLTNCAYWWVIAVAVYLAFQYLLSISVPVLLGILVAYLVVGITKKVHCTSHLVRILVAAVIYGMIGLLVTLLAAKGISAVTDIIGWLPEMSEQKLIPFIMLGYNWVMETVSTAENFV